MVLVRILHLKLNYKLRNVSYASELRGTIDRPALLRDLSPAAFYI